MEWLPPALTIAAVSLLLLGFERNRRAQNMRKIELQTALSAIKAELLAREELDQALLKAKQDWERTFDAAPDLIAILDSSHRIVRCNRALADRLGVSPAELVNRHCHEVIHGSGTPIQACPHSLLLADGCEHRAELVIHQLAGCFEVTATPLVNDGKLIGSVHIARDVTDKVQHRQREADYLQHLQELSRSQAVIQERERRRLATLLHDQIGQNLALTRIKLGMLLGEVTEKPQAERIRGLQQLVGEIIDATRSLTIEISPPALYQVGLGAALESLAETFRRRHGFELSVTGNENAGSLSEETRMVVYQAVRELSFNILKHAGVNAGEIVLSPGEDWLEISVIDSGCGMSPVQNTQKRSFGLFNVREQLQMIGGELAINSTQGGGTRVTMRVPLQQAEEVQARLSGEKIFTVNQ